MRKVRAHSTPAVAASVAAHLLGVGVLIVALRHQPSSLSPLHLPGTPQGQHMLLTYSPGGPAEMRQNTLVRHTAPKAVTPKAAQASPQPALTTPPSAPQSEMGSGTSGDSARGDENVRVALPQVHPRPQPDLSALPHGTAGDVIVDVVIDDVGKVTTATLVKGLGPSVDTTVINALRDWTFTPATRNGQNIASEQEILIHYERG